MECFSQTRLHDIRFEQLWEALDEFCLNFTIIEVNHNQSRDTSTHHTVCCINLREPCFKLTLCRLSCLILFPRDRWSLSIEWMLATKQGNDGLSTLICIQRSG